MDINKDTQQPQKGITVMVQYSRTGPWTPVRININPQAFIDAKSKEVYLRNIVENSVMGCEIISLQHNYSVEQAKCDLKQE